MKRWWIASCVGCAILGGTALSASAAIYDLTYVDVPNGDGEYTFKGMFDSDVPNSGSGTIHFDPFEGGSPFDGKLSGLNFTIDSTTGPSTGTPVTEVNLTTTIVGFDFNIFPLYFFTTSTGYQFDEDDNTFIGDATLSLAAPSTVPLPTAAPMFGLALLTLGAVGYGMERKKAVATA